MRNPKFNGKEEYLAYRSAWKAEYAQLSKDIRDLKFARNFPHANRFDNPKNVERYREIEKRLFPYTDSQWKLSEYRDRAYRMLEELKVAKAEAQVQYLVVKTQTEEENYQRLISGRYETPVTA